LGHGLEGENIADLLRYFLHKTELNNNCAVAWAEQGRKTTLEQFYKDYLRTTSTSLLAKGPTESAVFKNGRYAFSLDTTWTTALYFARGIPIKQRVLIDNHVLHVISNSSKIKSRNITVRARMTLESNPHASATELKEIKTALDKKIKTEILDMLEFTYRKNADVLGLYEHRLDFKVKVDVDVIT